MTLESATPDNRPRVLVMHALRPTSRQTTIDHLLSFREHLPHADVQYLHFQQPLPKEFEDIEVDLLIVNYDYLNYRFTPLWPYVKRRHIGIARRAKKVVAIAQDDFWANKLLDNWCMDWDVDRILTPIDNDLEVLYPRSIKTKEFKTALTGYVKSGPVSETKLLRDRPIDLGQRVREMPPHLGRLAQAKARQAVTMAEAATNAGFKVDVSTRVEDSFIGTAWFDFLASCKFTVGMKGGASLHDPRGLIHTKVQSYLARHPGASFNEIERKCFKGKDMKHEFTAISPRLFESAMAGTCQILQREDYLGVLEPWRDFIPLESDFSNLDEVIRAMKDLDHCQEIVSNAKRSLIESKMFDYSQLVETACNGLLLSRGVSSANWNQFSEFLQFSQKAQESVPELHDATLHLISEVLIPSAPLSLSALQIKQAIDNFEGSDWLKEMTQLTKEDSMSTRSPWIWRSVPTRKAWDTK
jgi:hypothetical protein